MGNCLSSDSSKAPAASAPPAAGGAGVKPAPPPAASTGKAAAKPKEKKKSDNYILGKDTPDINTVFLLGKVLGRGQFGTTRLAVERSTQAQYACKSISKRKLTTAEDIEDVRREIQIMHHLAGHPNIVTLKEAFEDKHSVHLIMELCAGGELFDRIVARGHYSEKDAATLIRTMVKVVAHCHQLGVIHRDLKPENFLLADTKEDATLKATDFGLSVFFKGDDVYRDIVGSAYYVAPEVLRRHYSKEADIWSCGVILYILVCGVPPFWGDTEQQIFDSILKGRLDFSSDPWPTISLQAQDCIKRMLVQDPRKRATADEILQHEWMKENGVASDKPLDSAIASRIKKFANLNRLKKEALKVMAKNMAVEEVTGLRQLFKSIDTDGSGTITVEELRTTLKKQNKPVIEAELNELLHGADIDGDGTIDYEEFLAATVHLSKLNKEENLRAAFEHFDKDSSGYITMDELKEALKQVQDMSVQNIEQILKEVDKDNNGKIDYDEFCTMMRGDNDIGAHQLKGGLNLAGATIAGAQ
mmetsp:Transcript_21427/g.55882  ORF Transcript_21427/g.55882 Transcript_21427/m.55882 type:complete len:529 (-) Transcript_21427:189-1775(-)